MNWDDSAREPLAAGARFGSYEVRHPIGRGGAGVVYEAVHCELGRRVALKVLHQDGVLSETATARLRREARTLSRLRHPSLVEVLDLGVEQGVPYMVMEFLEGESLSEVIARGPMPAERAVDLMLSALSALSAVHDVGVVHRDIKPSNLFVVAAPWGERMKVLDFGLCAVLDETSSLTQTGRFIGTPHYAAPELLDGGRAADRRVDVYGMALVLFECLTGRRAFTEDRIVALVGAIARGVQTAPSALVPTVPRELDEVISRACAVDPGARMASATEFAQALLPFASEAARRRWRDEIPRQARHHPDASQPSEGDADLVASSKSPGRTRGFAWVVALGVVLVAGVAALRSGRGPDVTAPRMTAARTAALTVVDAGATDLDVVPLDAPSAVMDVGTAVTTAPSDAGPRATRATRPHDGRRDVRRDDGRLPVRDPSMIFGGARER